METSTPRPHESIDLTPEEFAEVFGKIDLDDDKPAKKPIVSAVLASHLAGGQADRVKAYARHYAISTGHRVGLIEVDASEFRLTRFEPGVESHAVDDGGEGEPFDARHMTETLEELNFDVDHWLLLVANPRLPESRTLLRAVGQWVLLSTCDHDGVVSSYRTVKSLADLHRPRLSLALLDSPSDPEAAVIFRKLSSVCQQFLHWPLESQSPVRAADNVAEQVVMHCRPLHDKAQLAAAPQWRIVGDFLAHAVVEPIAEIESSDDETRSHDSVALPGVARFSGPPTRLTNRPDKAGHADEDTTESRPSAAEPIASSDEAALAHDSDIELEEEMPHLNAHLLIDEEKEIKRGHAAPASFANPPATEAPAVKISFASPVDSASDVVDLPSLDASPATILSAVIRHQPGALVECPVRPPMCPEATLAVDREHGLVLLAVARAGLADFRAIGQAYQWLSQNRTLIGMAVPQFSIDCHRLPQLRLLVDHRDMTADLLQPMLEAGHVSVQAYRKLRWGEKTGLLLEAA
jgi:hypothetical protein